MNVAVLSTCSRSAGGLFYSVRWLSKALAALGCRPTLFSPPDEFSQADLHVWDPVPVELYPAFGPMGTSFKLRKMLAQSGADLVHVHGIWLDSQWAAMQHQRKRGVPVVVSPRGMLDPWAVQNAAWKKKLVEKLFARKALDQATCIHALCRSEVESIREYGLKNPVALIPNGIELPEVEPRKPTEGKKTLLFLGRIHPKKGLAELLQAWGRFSGDWNLVVAGWDDGNHEQGLKALADQLGVGDTVSFVGSKYGEEKEQLLRSVDAFVLPSFSEGLPMSVLEAWSFRLPVVMTDFCNLPEGFAADAAIRVEPNADSILLGLDQLANLPEPDRLALGSNGRKLVEKKFTWPQIAKNMRQVYDWCLNGGNVPECIETT